MEEKPIRVLLVEDDPDDAFLLQDTLQDVKSARFEMERVDRLQEGLRRLREGQFDVALLDLSLPDSQGLETFLELHREAPQLPVVVLTGLDDENMAVSAVHEGAQDYLVKGQVDAGFLVLRIRYAIERQRTSHYQELLTERERFDAAVSQMSDGILVTDGDWVIANANRAACLLINLAEDARRGQPLAEALAEFTLSVPMEALQESQDHSTAFVISREDTHPPLYLDARLSRLFDSAGNLTSTVLVLRDDTDERLSRYVQANFFSMVPHKLRTPLAILGGYLEMSKHLPPEKIAREWGHILVVCEKELAQVTDIVQKLLDFKALSTWDLQQEVRSTEAAAQIANVAEDVFRRYPLKNVQFSVNIAPGAGLVEATPEHLEFVLEQLLDNAVKFGDKDPQEVSVSVAGQSDGLIGFSVKDNGPGIPHEYFDRIFEGFIQIEERVTGQVPGLGVGLCMARQVVEACGGTLGVQSRLGEGSTLTFTLPAARSSSPPGAAGFD